MVSEKQQETKELPEVQLTILVPGQEAIVLYKCPSYPRHSVTENGDVYSHLRHGGVKWDRNVRNDHTSMCKLKKYKRPDGYYEVSVSSEYMRRNLHVHYFVTDAFYGPKPDGLDTRHLDGNKTNNHYTNLCYGTRSENMLDSIKHGQTVHRGEKSGMSKLKDADIDYILTLHHSGYFDSEIARMYNVKQAAIRSIYIGRTWKHMPRWD